MIYLDTHVVVWLYAGLVDKFSQQARSLINEHEIFISPIVRLELQYLYEIQRLTVDANTIVSDLSSRIGLKVCDKPFNTVIVQALTSAWTRDPFDRIIVAQAELHHDVLISKDRTILEYYSKARW
ncbi:MAG: PIN domain-containing protein [Chloroflexi bacterium]|nr:MAG: PIN domain-containing protein [Chloroflexota bacterium]